MKKPLTDRVAIVTGAGQGIGRAHALRLAEEGARVVVNDIGADVGGEGRNTSRAEQVASEIRTAGGEAISSVESVASLDSSRQIVQAALDAFGRVDILINNAGVLRPNFIFDVTERDIELTLVVHLKGTIAMTMAVAPHFKKQRSGVVINTGSESGLGHYGNSIYAAAKEGIAGFTRAIARDFGPHGVRANLLRPAALSGQSESGVANRLMEEAEHVHGFKTAADYWLTELDFSGFAPSHVADFMVWLCTDAAAHVNGRDFRVMGGQIGMMGMPPVVRSVYRDRRWKLDDLNKPNVAAALHGDLTNEFLSKQLKGTR